MKCKIVIDGDMCTGHGRCYDLAPNLFEPYDDEGRSQPTVEEVADEQLDLAQRAVEACPENAITLVEAE